VLRWRQRLAYRLRSKFGADRFQGLNARRQEIAVFVESLVKLPQEEFCLSSLRSRFMGLR
jgi:hypothetical protein